MAADVDRLFVDTIDFLRHRVLGDRDNYQLLLASGKLRLLLMDSPRLLDEVNRKRRLKIKFRVYEHGEPPVTDGLILHAMPHGFGPAQAVANIPILEVGLDRLLKSTALSVDRVNITVGDVIKHTANVEGGVHAGHSDTDGQRRLDGARHLATLNGSTISVSTIEGIVAVVVEGLTELYDEVRSGR